MTSKPCTKCGTIKEYAQFRKNRERRDGLSSICRECFKEYDRKQRNRPEIIELRKKYKGKYKHTETDNERLLQWRKLHPEVQKASIALNYAVEKGVIPRIHTMKCDHCGKQAREYHHYKGYAPEHRLDVIPLCSSCHRKEHGRFRRARESEKETISTI